MGSAARHTAQQTRPAGSHDCWSAKILAQRGRSSGISAKILAQRAIKRQFLAIVSTQGELFVLAPTSGRAGRQISRTGRRNMATLIPTTPLHAPNTGPLKPPSPLRPKNAPKTPISHPQRRWRFQTHTGTSKQRRQGFQLRLSLREQRRQGFHTTGPPGRQGQAAVPAGPEAMSGPAISHLVSLTRTLTR